MLRGHRILVAEDETFIALDIAVAIEDAHGQVIALSRMSQRLWSF